MSSPQWTSRKSLFCLIGSTCFTLAVFFGIQAIWKKSTLHKLKSEVYQTCAIIQTGPEKEALKTAYLAELLGLSADRPFSLYAIDLKKAEKKLLSSPLISSARIKRLPPKTLYIDYEVRKPEVLLADYQNTAVDREGYLFPLTPFLSPKHLPEIYLGLPSFGAPEDRQGRRGGEWLTPMKNKYLTLAFEVLSALEGSPWREGLTIKRVDVSNAFAPSLGQREIVLFTEEEVLLHKETQEIVCVFPKILRLAPKEYAQQLKYFFALRRSMAEDYKKQLETARTGGRFVTRIVDLRIPQLAFVENNPS